MAGHRDVRKLVELDEVDAGRLRYRDAFRGGGQVMFRYMRLRC
jgi:hypothetical protein